MRRIVLNKHIVADSAICHGKPTFDDALEDGPAVIAEHREGLPLAQLGDAHPPATSFEWRRAVDGSRSVVYTHGVMEMRQYISIDPAICHGKPCFKGTRIMVYLVLEMLEADATLTDIKAAYPSLTQEHVKAALEFAARAVETGRYDAALMTPHRHAIPGR